MASEETQTSQHPNSVPLHEGLFTWPSDNPRLIASKCVACGRVSFPRRDYCNNPRCPRGEIQEIRLSNRARLFSYTIMMYPGQPPFEKIHAKVPYGIGVLELPEGVCILGLLSTIEKSELRLGLEMEMFIDRLCTNDDGRDVVTYRYRPMSQER